MTNPTVFIAGTMQGASNDLQVADQSYRDVIRNLVLQRWPDARCVDPSKPVRELVNEAAADHGIRDAIYGQLSGQRINLDDLSDEVQRFREAFRRMTVRAADCDLVIAYIPGTAPSMGTAMEMYQAFIASVPVVAITNMRVNLSIVSTATWILSDLNQLEAWLEEHDVDTNEEPHDKW